MLKSEKPSSASGSERRLDGTHMFFQAFSLLLYGCGSPAHLSGRNGNKRQRQRRALDCPRLVLQNPIRAERIHYEGRSRDPKAVILIKFIKKQCCEVDKHVRVSFVSKQNVSSAADPC